MYCNNNNLLYNNNNTIYIYLLSTDYLLLYTN